MRVRDCMCWPSALGNLASMVCRRYLHSCCERNALTSAVTSSPHTRGLTRCIGVWHSRQGSSVCRGVPVDTYQFENNLASGKSNFTGSYGVHYKFAVPSWRASSLTGDRPLQEVGLWGNHQGPSTGGKIKVWGQSCMHNGVVVQCESCSLARTRVKSH